ncbi:SDR family oxidoreductase [Achromobacter sp. Marseille-Q0513]|uniref:SDR family NAD(P)-dependent oxidoreductase n=1 Tax=Achromobacter sp. Marseille-Q0513 TaxID=2829161 RepID=UPI001B9D64F1|nr:SDR family oxidoreductase [Achromobacter sp. Marseille-Q0513]MBR8653833.1 SDR family oxidoreductase [Achromobacter sp. Marseille-Q0513]
MSFSGKTIVIAGGTSGIGMSLASRFTSLGNVVIILGRDDRKGKLTEAQLGKNSRFLQCDVSDHQAVERVFQEIDTEYSGFDLAVNNAGITTPYSPVADVAAHDWEQNISINLSGVFHCMKHQIPVLQRKPGGAIVNVSSCAGVVPLARQAPYVSSKAAVNALTQVAALEYAFEGGNSHPVRINAIAPGPTLGGMNTAERLAANPANTEKKRNATAMRRFAEPKEIVEAVEWLLSERASYVTGTILNVDGGYAAGKLP